MLIDTEEDDEFLIKATSRHRRYRHRGSVVSVMRKTKDAEDVEML